MDEKKIEQLKKLARRQNDKLHIAKIYFCLTWVATGAWIAIIPLNWACRISFQNSPNLCTFEVFSFFGLVIVAIVFGSISHKYKEKGEQEVRSEEKSIDDCFQRKSL